MPKARAPIVSCFGGGRWVGGWVGGWMGGWVGELFSLSFFLCVCEKGREEHVSPLHPPTQPPTHTLQ